VDQSEQQIVCGDVRSRSRVDFCRSFADKKAFDGKVADGDKRLRVVLLCSCYQETGVLNLADAPVSDCSLILPCEYLTPL
jgi:hypothetical protein